MKMGKQHKRAHDAFSDLKRPLDPVEVYEAMCSLLKLGEDAVERGLGKLFREGKIKSTEKVTRGKVGKVGKRGPAAQLDEDDFS